jgi:hypothetical protein
VSAHPDTDKFNQTAFIATPEIVDCTLENGVDTHCYKLTVGFLPKGLKIGPFCPRSIDDEGGIWDWTGDNAGLYRINRRFLMMLDKLGYRFFDDDGTVHIVDFATSPPEDEHACINVAADEDVKVTMLLPIDPVMADKPTSLGTVAKVGVALDGVPIFADAPSIQQTGHMPALDICGGHIDPGGWYHWHATATDIETVYDAQGLKADCSIPQDSSAMFGYAFDGFPMYGSTEADGTTPNDLDACGGHVGKTANSNEEIYHYHGAKDFPNLPTCLVGVQARGNFTTTAHAGIGGEGGRGPGPGDTGHQGPGGPPNFAEVANKLGVSEAEFTQAIENNGGRHLDISAAATALGVSEADLRSALPPKPR